MLKKYYILTVIFTAALIGFDAHATSQPDEDDSINLSGTRQPSKEDAVETPSSQKIDTKKHLDIKPYSQPVEILDRLYENREITSLNLAHTFFSDELALYLPKYCANLTDLNLSFCEISDNGVDLVARSYPHIQVLDLSYNCLTDKSLSSLALNCSSLTSLKLKANIEITDDGLKYLVQHCKHLSYLGLPLYKPSDASLREIKGMLPDLKIEWTEKSPSKSAKQNASSKNKGGARKKKNKNRNKKTQIPMPIKVQKNQNVHLGLKVDSPTGRDILLEFEKSWESGIALVQEKKIEQGLDCLNKAVSKLDPKDEIYQKSAAAIRNINQILADSRTKK